MGPIPSFSISTDSEGLAVLKQLLESERDRLLVEIRHTDHRNYRDELRHRLEIIERLSERCLPE